MRISHNSLDIDEIDLKEVFALFTSVSLHELRQLDDPNSDHYFRNVDLAAEYELSSEKREFAIDALRAAFAFLERHGYRIEKEGTVFDLQSVGNLFV